MEVKNFLDPKNILNQLTITPGCTVADFGCGSAGDAFAQGLPCVEELHRSDIDHYRWKNVVGC